MKFQLRPILSEIKELYLKPISNSRFKEYMAKLQGGTKGDLVLPISGFNPMAKKHIIQKIEELENIGAETIMEKTVRVFNSNLTQSNDDVIKVVLNIADDLKGAWTNFYSTDFDSKFKLSAFVNRKFCVPYFWTSETYTKELIRIRTTEYLSRTLYQLNNPKPKRLEEHVEQEIFVSKNTQDNALIYDRFNVEEIENYYSKNKNSEEYDLIFNFFYGDMSSENLGYKSYGIKDMTGFDYAKFIAMKRKQKND